jgi:bifunctional DNase/RNase
MKRRLDARLKPKLETIELEAFGLTSGMDKGRPVMLFREKGGEAVLPVWLSPLDAGIALTQHNAQTFTMSPHEVTVEALKVMGVRPTECHFTEVKGHQQYVDVKFAGSRKLKSLRARADHAISFCLQTKVKFYCTREYLVRCREVEAEMGQNRASLGASRSEMRRGRNFYLN